MRRVRLWVGPVLLAEDVEYAERMHDRMRGLLGRSGLEAGRGMWLTHCGSIHTFGMAFTLDVAFFDGANRLVRLHRRVGPWRMALGGVRARSAFEVESGWLDWDVLRQSGESVRLEFREI